MSSLARSLIEDPLARPEGSRKWPTFRKGGCSLRPVDRWPPTRNLYLRAARSVASEVPKRYSTHPARLNHATRDLSAESNTNRKRTTTQVQELERRNVLEEAAHLMLPGVVREEEEKEHLRTLLAHRTTWLRDVAVVAVVAGAILAAVADKETTLRAQNLSSKKETENIDLGKGPDIQVGKEAVHQVPIDSIRRGRLVENGFVYRQTFVVRSYEVGFDRTASIGTLANLFQETALNHVGMSDIVGDGMGTTHAMMSHRLIWVVTKMHIRIVDFPVWGDVVEIDSWVSESGKNGMRRDFLVRDYVTGQVRARATSHWAMMNQDSRKLSKMPDDVRAEITPYFLDRSVMSDESCLKIKKLDDRAPHVKSGLVPRLHDMDMNQHVNHVKYISWVLEVECSTITSGSI
ncbi:hypothetical protein KP509_11G010500 [Ceratopteris richardii]|uniref:Acyl-[acyl-carrier-protein] hydrolase n=1 Tax=Ceratopteris richardii TaxID=49495 RepID=A0A8T2TMA0_CERRI|nr:hypothetical protein KP509_11G010500 [Ceratopteris richardii]